MANEGAAALAVASNLNSTTASAAAPPPPRRSIGADISGWLRLGSDAVHKTTQLVEAQHSRLDFLGNAIFADRGKDKARNPIAALVYNSIYTINSLVGTSLDCVVNTIEPHLGDTEPSQRKEAALAILNGVVGDYLEDQKNPLAISMQWRKPNEKKNHRYLLLIHGSCNSPQDWWQEGHNHGMALTEALDYTPLFLHYNTGLHISENGKLLSKLIQELVDENKVEDKPIQISIVGHSMGGLVARSACHLAEQEKQEWLQHVNHLVTFACPHHGAMLERGGKLVDAVLGAHQFTEPLSWLGKIRSKGVTDLGYGNIQEADWKDKEGVTTDTRVPSPLPKNIRTMALAAVLGDMNASSNRLLGESMRTDGLVTEASALGKGHTQPEMNLEFEESLTFYNTSHVGMLSSEEVYDVLLKFLSGKKDLQSVQCFEAKF